LCATLTSKVDIKDGAVVTIEEWYTNDPSPDNPPINNDDFGDVGGSGAVAFTVSGQFDEANDLIDEITLTSAASYQITTTETGLCSYSLNFFFLGRKRAPLLLNSLPLTVGSSSAYFQNNFATFAFGDPHFVGPNGEKFDFNGQSGGVYSLLSSARYAINVQVDDLASGHARFMTKFGIVVGGTSVVLDTVRHNANYIAYLNKKLSLAGAKASYGKTATGDNTFQTVIDVCPGQRVIVTQKRTTALAEKNLHLNSTLHYLDFELDIAGCHDEFGGVVGQLHQCKYATTKFVWDPKSEESFRVPTLMTPSSSSSKDAPCLASHQFGAAFTGKAKSR